MTSYILIYPGSMLIMGFPHGSVVKNLPANAGDISLSLGQKIPWRRNWQPTRVLSWKIPWAEETGGLQSMRLQKVDMIEQAHAILITINCFGHSEELLSAQGTGARFEDLLLASVNLISGSEGKRKMTGGSRKSWGKCQLLYKYGVISIFYELVYACLISAKY